MEIRARKRLAVVYQCPECGVETVDFSLTSKKSIRRPHCYSSACGLKYDFLKEPLMEPVKQRFYTLFVEETDLNGTIRAGTLEKIGQFDVCQIVHPDIRAFRAWYKKRKEENLARHRKYMEEWARRQAKAEEKRRQAEAEKVQRPDIKPGVVQPANTSLPSKSQINNENTLDDCDEFSF